MSQTDEILARLEEAGQSQGAFGGIGPSACRTVAACITQLRSRLDAVEKERDQWKANHDNQVAIKQAVLDRPDLGDRALRVMGLRNEIYVLAKATENLLLTLAAHDVESLDCDRRGNKYCDCLANAINTASAAVCTAKALQPPPESGSEVRG